MKHFIAARALAAVAIVVRFVVLQSFGVDIHLHYTYWVVPVREIGFWLLIAITSVWFLLAAYKFVRHGS